MAAAVLSRTDNMTGLMDEVHSPASFGQGHSMPATSGIFSYCSTAQADLCAWDAGAEGPQNFHGYPDAGDFYRRGDSEEYSAPFGQVSRQVRPSGTAEEHLQKWNAAAAADSLVPGSEPAQRVTSVASSVGRRSHKSHKSVRTQAAKSAGSSSAPKRGAETKLHRAQNGPARMSDYDMTGNSTTYSGESGSNAHMSGAEHYLSPAESVSSQTYIPGILALPDGLPFGDLAPGMAQHVNPLSTQMNIDFDPTLGAQSPPNSWGSHSSGSNSPPSLEDTWPGALVTSPTDTGISSPEFLGHDASLVQGYGGHPLITTEVHPSLLASQGSDDFLLPPGAELTCHSADTESARTHHLYTDAAPGEDGLFHCPWEGQESCNHKPEKLKCNYHKYVDSHLKPYRCKHDSCGDAKFSSTACLLRHEREAHAMHGHGNKPYLCTYEGCERAVSGNGFPRHWNLKDHMKRVHSDNAAPAAPAPSGQVSSSGSGQSTKGRKRKTKDAERSTSRKPLAKSTPVIEQNLPASADTAVSMDAAEWYEHQRALLDIAKGLKPDAANAQEIIKDAYSRLGQLSSLTERRGSRRKEDVLQRTWERTLPKRHSG